MFVSGRWRQWKGQWTKTVVGTTLCTDYIVSDILSLCLLVGGEDGGGVSG